MLPLQQIRHITAEWFQRGVRLGRPDRRHLPIHHAGKHLFKLRRHHNQTFDGLLQVDQCGAYNFGESVEPDELLTQHSVHRLGIYDRIFLDHLL